MFRSVQKTGCKFLQLTLSRFFFLPLVAKELRVYKIDCLREREAETRAVSQPPVSPQCSRSLRVREFLPFENLPWLGLSLAQITLLIQMSRVERTTFILEESFMFRILSWRILQNCLMF